MSNSAPLFSLKIANELDLRLIELRHAQTLFKLTETNRLYLREWLPWLDKTTTVTDTEAFIRSCQASFADNKGFTAGIWSEGSLCGVIGHHEFNVANRSTALGYWLARSHQGKGIITNCCRAVITHAFSELGMNRITIRCATDNKRSRAIPERLGFCLEGIARQAEWLYDHFVDHAVYALLKSDLENRLARKVIEPDTL